MTELREELMKTLIQGRLDSYVSKTNDYNPYVRSDIYDWYFEKRLGELVFTDAYRGFNPYNGLEYLYRNGNSIPIWSCGYVGYVNHESKLNESEVYGFLKEGRRKHLEECGGKLFSDFDYRRDDLRYILIFQEKDNEILEKVDIYHFDRLIAQHIAAGKIT